MVFYSFLGWLVFWISLVLAIVLFTKYKKLYPVFYLITVALYIFTVGYMIDVFKFGDLRILITFILSAVIFMGLGYYLSHVLRNEKE